MECGSWNIVGARSVLQWTRDQPLTAGYPLRCGRGRQGEENKAFASTRGVQFGEGCVGTLESEMLVCLNSNVGGHSPYPSFF